MGQGGDSSKGFDGAINVFHNGGNLHGGEVARGDWIPRGSVLRCIVLVILGGVAVEPVAQDVVVAF